MEPFDKHIHRQTVVDSSTGLPVLSQIEFHYDCDVACIDRLALHVIHPITGQVMPNFNERGLDDEMVNEILAVLQEDGIL
jgi:hypothetical protein